MELVVVTAILGLVALISIPNFSSGDSQKLEAVAAEIATALRFARSEAMRSGEAHGVYASSSNQRVRVYWLDRSVSPPLATYSVRHPVDKKIYDLQFSGNTLLEEVSVANVYFKFVSQPSLEYLGFDNQGYPVHISASGIDQLEAARVTLNYRGHQRLVQVEPFTGRVTVQ